MNKVLLLTLFIVICGCKTAEKKILDLSGSVFIIYIIIMLVNFIGPHLFKNNYIKKLNYIINPILLNLVWPLRIVGILSIIIGLSSEMLWKIFVFVGTIIFILSYLVKYYAISEFNDEIRARYLRMITLSVSFVIALLFLFHSGTKFLRL